MADENHSKKLQLIIALQRIGIRYSHGELALDTHGLAWVINFAYYHGGSPQVTQAWLKDLVKWASTVKANVRDLGIVVRKFPTYESCYYRVSAYLHATPMESTVLDFPFMTALLGTVQAQGSMLTNRQTQSPVKISPHDTLTLRLDDDELQRLRDTGEMKVKPVIRAL